MAEIQTLIQAVQTEAKREEFPIDEPVYRGVKKDPFMPILYGGNLKGELCFFGRDLGKDEVASGQPLIGAAGKWYVKVFFGHPWPESH